MKKLMPYLASAVVGGLTVLLLTTSAWSSSVSSLKRALREPVQECVDYANNNILKSKFGLEGEGRLLEVIEKSDDHRLISVSFPNEDSGYLVYCSISSGSGMFNWPIFAHASWYRFQQ